MIPVALTSCSAAAAEILCNLSSPNTVNVVHSSHDLTEVATAPKKAPTLTNKVEEYNLVTAPDRDVAEVLCHIRHAAANHGEVDAAVDATRRETKRTRPRGIRST